MQRLLIPVEAKNPSDLEQIQIFYATLMSYATALKEIKDSKAIKDIYQRLCLQIQRHHTNMKFLQTLPFITITEEAVKRINRSLYYHYMLPEIKQRVEEKDGKDYPALLKAAVMNPVSQGEAKEDPELKEDEDSSDAKGIIEVDAYIAIQTARYGYEKSTSWRKQKLLSDLQSGTYISGCRDNAKLLFAFQQLQEINYFFLNQRGDNCLFNFFRRHHTTKTYAILLDMFKTQIMLNQLIALYKNEVPNLTLLKGFSYQAILNAQRYRFRGDNGTKANEFINRIDPGNDVINKHVLTEALKYYCNKFEKLWPNHSLPYVPYIPFTGQSFRLGGL